MKEYLFIGGFFDEVDEKQILKFSKKNIQYAANEFQRKLIEGFISNINEKEINKISAPFVSPYPRGYKKIFFKSKGDSNIYVDFLNIFAVRNISRSRALKKILRKYSFKNKEKIIIFVYSVHTPLINAAIYLKKRNRNVHICLIAPDLPQYMELSNNQSNLYKLLKKIDGKVLKNKLKNIDSFVLLTEQMNSEINLYNKKHIVVEGIVDKSDPIYESALNEKEEDYILYTGTLNEKYGVLDLLYAYNKIKNCNVKLMIAGSGDSEKKIKKLSKLNNNIVFLGQVTNEEAKKLQKNALFLVNPRKNVEEFTKYSFPSKNLEYLSSGRPVVCYKLEGIPSEYDNIFQYAGSDLSEKLIDLLALDRKKLDEIGLVGKEFVKENKNSEIQCKKILDMIERS